MCVIICQQVLSHRLRRALLISLNAFGQEYQWALLMAPNRSCAFLSSSIVPSPLSFSPFPLDNSHRAPASIPDCRVPIGNQTVLSHFFLSFLLIACRIFFLASHIRKSQFLRLLLSQFFGFSLCHSISQSVSATRLLFHPSFRRHLNIPD